MFALDLFNNDHERRLAEGAVDQLEQRRIDDLAMRMDDLVARAHKATTPEAKAALVKEFQKCKDERDGYFKIKDECMGYGSLGEQGLPDVADKQAKMARLNQPGKVGTDIVTPQQRVAGATMPSNTALGKAKETFTSFTNWLAGKDDTGPTYETTVKEQTSAISPVTAAKYAYEQMRKAHDDNVDIATVRWMNNPEPITMSRNQLYHTLVKLKNMSRQNRNQFALQTLADRNNFALWLGGQKKVQTRPQLKQPSDPFQPQLPLGKPGIQERAQKKNSEDQKFGDTETANAVRKIRAKHPAARSDVEALAKDEIEHTKRSDQQLAAIKGANTEQDALLRQLVALDKKQGEEIDNLDSENNSQEQELNRIQATNTSLQKTIQSMTGTKRSSRPKQTAKTAPQTKTSEPTSIVAPSGDPEIEKKLQGLETQIQSLQSQPQSPEIVKQIDQLQNRINALPAQAAQALNIDQDKVAQPAKVSQNVEKQYQRVQAPFGDLDVEPPKAKPKAKSKAKTTAPKATPVSKPVLKPEDEFDLLNIDESNMSDIDAMRQDLERMNERQFFKAYGISKAAFQQKYRALLKPANLGEHGGGIGPRQHWQDLMQERTLSVGDPIVVTGPNEFEGKTGEIYDFSPSGTFVIVDLYNHGKHSMHLSDIAYNEYADQEQDEEDDWYDEMDEGWKGGVAGGVAGATGGEVLGSKAGEALGKAIGGHIGAGAVPAPLSSLGNKAGEAIGGVVGSKLGAVVGSLAGGAGGAAIGNKLGDEVDEGFQDFNKVEPYAVCLAGKPVKKFDYYEEARRFHDNWKKKLYREGNKEKADKITLMPLNLDEEEQKPAGWGEFPPKQEITIVPFKKLKSGETYQDQNKYWQSQGQAPIYKTNEAGSPAQQAAIAIAMKKAGKKPKSVDETALNPRDPAGDYAAKRKALQDLGMNKGVDQAAVQQRRLDLDREAKAKGIAEDTGSWIVYDPETKQIKKRFKTHTAGKSYAKTHGLGFASSEFYFDNIKNNKEVAEALTDYQKRRQRERDVDAGRPVKALPKNPQTDYARKRAKDRKDMELGEGADLINMSDLQFYKELLGVMVIPVAAFGAMAWNKAMNAIKLYRAEEVVTALQKKGVTVDRSTLEQIKPLLLKLEQAIDVDKDGDTAKELAKRIQQTVTWGKLKQANPKTDAQPTDTKLGENLMKEPANRKEYLDQRDKLFRMLSVESDSASKQIIKQAIKDLDARYGSAKDPIREESSTGSEAVEIAIIKRILVAHTDLIMEFGLDKVTQAIEEVAYNVGDVDEIGTSDVSAYVHQVKQILGVPEELDEKWSQKYKSSINCANPKGFSQKAHCAGKKK